jgi:hypothetical protein
MSFTDPVRIIDHIPQDFDMKRITRKRPLQQRKLAKAQSAKAAEPSSFEPPCEQVSAIWKAVAFIGSLAIVFAALITGGWER